MKPSSFIQTIQGMNKPDSFITFKKQTECNELIYANERLHS